MSTRKPRARSSKPAKTEVRHSKEDALDERQYEQLLAATHRLKDYYALECRLVILLAGRLGMRAGEIAHMTHHWIDWRRNMIVIPRHETCTNGRDGGVCGYCVNLAEQMVNHNEHLTIDEAKAEMWSPKTEAGAREIPFDADTRAMIVLEQYFDRFDEYQSSRQSVNRRVNRAAEEANDVEKSAVYPHCLRATAATRFAAKGLDVFALKAMMGWANLSTAHKYVSSSGERTAQAIRDTTI